MENDGSTEAWARGLCQFYAALAMENMKNVDLDISDFRII